jgi:hypothetical protein
MVDATAKITFFHTETFILHTNPFQTLAVPSPSTGTRYRDGLLGEVRVIVSKKTRLTLSKYTF